MRIKWLLYILITMTASLILYFGGQFKWEEILVVIVFGFLLYLPYHVLIDVVMNENPTPFQKIYRTIYVGVVAFLLFGKICYYIFDKI